MPAFQSGIGHRSNRQRITLTAPVLFFVTAAWHPAWAFREIDPYNLKGNELLRRCEEDVAACRGYIMGAAQTGKTLEFWMTRRDFRKYWHCAPRSVTLSILVNAVIASLKAEDPEELDLQDARYLVMAALSSTFPCVTF